MGDVKDALLVSPRAEQGPKVFISYSWTSEEYQNVVIDLAKRLMGDGIDVVLDVWNLKHGQSTHKFMESMVHDKTITKVLVLSDGRYADKANDRSGGVGTESEIISPKIYGDVDQTKFVPVVMERDAGGAPCLPTFLAGRLYVDYSGRDAAAYDELVRLLWNAPLRQKPSLGTKPKFLGSDDPVAEVLVGLLRQAERDGTVRLGPLVDELQLRSRQLVISPEGAEPLLQKIESRMELERQLRPSVRNALLLILRSGKSAAIRQEEVGEIFSALQASCLIRSGGSYSNGKDIVYFLARNVLLEVVAELLREKQYSLIRDFVTAEFVASDSRDRLEKFTEFSGGRPMIDGQLNEAKEAKKVSYSTDLFLTQPVADSPPREALLDADLLLFVFSVLQGEYHWVPYTSLYGESATPTRFYLRLSSSSAVETRQTLFGIGEWGELKNRVTAYTSKLKYPIVPGSHWGSYAMSHINMSTNT